MKKLIAVVAILLMTTQFVSALGQTPTTKIKYMSVYHDSVFIQFENAHNNEDGCTLSRANEFVALTDIAGENKAVYSSILTSYATQGKVVVAYDGCIGDFPKMIRLDFIR